MIIHEAFNKLVGTGLVRDQYHFDQAYLRRPRGHYSYLKSSGAEASVDTLLRLYLSLEGELERRPNVQHTYKVLDELSASIWREMQLVGTGPAKGTPQSFRTS